MLIEEKTKSILMPSQDVPLLLYPIFSVLTKENRKFLLVLQKVCQ